MIKLRIMELPSMLDRDADQTEAMEAAGPWSAQVSILDGEANWADITPRRFTGTDGSDFNADRARGRRG